MISILRREFIKISFYNIGIMNLPIAFIKSLKFKNMSINKTYDIIIVGGSYSGLAAAMALGRALKNVLVIDEGKPCNRQTPFSHNFLTNDGKTPKEISEIAKHQVKNYKTIKFFNGIAINGIKTNNGFDITVNTGETFGAKKLIFATGIKDILPDIEGLATCWGISVLHCPFCHGYEVKDEATGILGNGDIGYDMVKLIYNWTNDLTLFTNGKSTLSTEQKMNLEKHKIKIVEKEVLKLEHNNGYVQNIIFNYKTISPIKAIYTAVPFEQHCLIPKMLGCEITKEGYIKTDHFQESSINGVFACGDNTTRMRTVANAVAMGTTAGMSLSKKMIYENF